MNVYPCWPFTTCVHACEILGGRRSRRHRRRPVIYGWCLFVPSRSPQQSHWTVDTVDPGKIVPLKAA